jgi:hypothetical protein
MNRYITNGGGTAAIAKPVINQLKFPKIPAASVRPSIFYMNMM